MPKKHHVFAIRFSSFVLRSSINITNYAFQWHQFDMIQSFFPQRVRVKASIKDDIHRKTGGKRGEGHRNRPQKIAQLYHPSHIFVFFLYLCCRWAVNKGQCLKGSEHILHGMVPNNSHWCCLLHYSGGGDNHRLGKKEGSLMWVNWIKRSFRHIWLVFNQHFCTCCIKCVYVQSF